jgi:hypothetical protein
MAATAASGDHALQRDPSFLRLTNVVVTPEVGSRRATS